MKLYYDAKTNKVIEFNFRTAEILYLMNNRKEVLEQIDYLKNNSEPLKNAPWAFKGIPAYKSPWGCRLDWEPLQHREYELLMMIESRIRKFKNYKNNFKANLISPIFA